MVYSFSLIKEMLQISKKYEVKEVLTLKIHVCDAVMGSKLMIGDFFFLNPSRGREDGSAHVVLELLSS